MVKKKGNKESIENIVVENTISSFCLEIIVRVTYYTIVFIQNYKNRGKEKEEGKEFLSLEIINNIFPKRKLKNSYFKKTLKLLIT